MLALTRKKGESIMIGDDIEIVILNIQGEQVKIGINAPKQISVHRREVYEQILSSNKESSQSVNMKAINQLFNNDKKSK